MMNTSKPSNNHAYSLIKQHGQVNVLGFMFDNVTMTNMYEVIKAYSKAETKHNLFVVTANPEIIHYASETPSYRNVIQQADYIIPDGTGIVKAAKILGTPLKERVPGIEVMETCLQIADKEEKRIFLLGATDEVITKAVRNIQTQYPNSVVAGHHGFFKIDDITVVNEIRDFQPDFIFVGMGYPRQEQWIAQHRDAFEHTFMMGVGGSIDVFSGTVKRAPLIWRKLNLEWLYRSFKDIKRIHRLKRIPKFIMAVFKQKIAHR